MTDTNHRRKNRAPVALRHVKYSNGYSTPALRCSDETRKTLREIQETDPTESYQRVGRTRMLDKSLHGWQNTSVFADKCIGADIGNDFSNGHRGMARAVAGAKKYVRSRTRFHEKTAVQKIMREL